LIKNGTRSIVRFDEADVDEAAFRKIVSVRDTFVMVPKNCRVLPGAPVSDELDKST